MRSEALHEQDRLSQLSGLPHDLGRWSDAVLACESLALLSAHTIVASSLHSNASAHFPPTIHIHSIEEPSPKIHPTTTSQCVTALQVLAPKVRRFHPGGSAASKLPFQIAFSLEEDLDPDDLYSDMIDLIDRSINALAATTSTPQSDLGHLHPLTCANVFRALSPAKEAMSYATWWEALWVMLFYLSGLEYAREGKPSLAAHACPPSAYLTSKCLDALESVINIVRTRRNRFNEILSLLSAIHKTETSRREIGAALLKLGCAKGSAYFKTAALASDHRIQELVTQLHNRLEEYEWMTAIPLAVKAWREAIPKPEEILNIEFISNHILLEFAKAILAQGDVLGQKRAGALEKVAKWRRTLQDCYHASSATASDFRTKKSARLHQLGRKTSSLPQWIYDPVIVAATRNVNTDQADVPLLHEHWYERSSAAGRATQVVKNVDHYIESIEATFLGILSRADPHSLTLDLEKLRKKLQDLRKEGAVLSEGMFGNLDPAAFGEPYEILDWLQNVSGSLNLFDEELAKHIQGAVAYADRTLHQQLSFEQSLQSERFDIAELAHALRIVTRFGERTDFRLVKLALDTICASQRNDGTWQATRPFLFQPSGFTAHPHGIEIAWAVVSIVKTVAESPHQFGMSNQEISSHLTPAYHALDKHFQWLNTAFVRFRPPTHLKERWSNHSRKTKFPSHVCGWYSDRTPLPGTIHPWVTANAIEFLSEYRDLLQKRVNDAIRVRFQSYNPANLHKLEKMSPTDLGQPYKDRIITQVRDIVQDHDRLDRLESTSYFHRSIDPVKPGAWSIILYGPPGTSKTHLAKGIAGELGWPLIALSPSDFLAGGEGEVERRAREIFDALRHGSRMVYFFDEIDELILDREVQKAQERSVFSFLTPSFLTKLQDLQDAAKERQFISIIATNYLERIDQAARRTGRVDRKFLVLYPDLAARVGMIVEDVIEMAKEAGLSIEAKLTGDLLRKWSRASALLPYLRIKQGTEGLWQQPDKVAKGLEKLDQMRAVRTAFGVGSEDQEVNVRSYVVRCGAEYEFDRLLELIRPDGGKEYGIEIGYEYRDIIQDFLSAYEGGKNNADGMITMDLKDDARKSLLTCSAAIGIP